MKPRLIEDFRRKFWRKALRITLDRLPGGDALEVLDPLWWALVRYRLHEISSSDLGLNTARLILGPPQADRGRELRDYRYR